MTVSTEKKAPFIDMTAMSDVTVLLLTFFMLTSTFIKKVTVGTYGDPAGYEECLFVTESGNYFLYVNGGADSKYPTEDIKRMSKKVADEWIANN